MKPTTEYRLRWQYPSGSWGSRGFEREHYARKAQAKYEERGLRTRLLKRDIIVMEPWAELGAPQPAQTVTDRQPVVGLCAHCDRYIELIDGEWLDSDRLTYCTEADDSTRHYV